jgi:hypothetical protein
VHVTELLLDVLLVEAGRGRDRRRPNQVALDVAPPPSPGMEVSVAGMAIDEVGADGLRRFVVTVAEADDDELRDLFLQRCVNLLAFLVAACSRPLHRVRRPADAEALGERLEDLKISASLDEQDALGALRTVDPRRVVRAQAGQETDLLALLDEVVAALAATANVKDVPRLRVAEDFRGVRRDEDLLAVVAATARRLSRSCS